MEDGVKFRNVEEYLQRLDEVMAMDIEIMRSPNFEPFM